MSHFGDLPGGLTQIFWDSLQADRFAALFAHTAEAVTIARTYIGYTDSKSIKIFHGEVKGRITTPPVGPREFQWDCVFVPEGYSETFAEMGARKHDVSMRRRALDSLAAHLSKTK
jgi:XTP/dITP diphosphohydrolase